jgi:YVTN family beta-propeller protein
LGLWGCTLAAACTASGEDVRPPEDELFFPSGLAVSPDEAVLFVANANSELRYDSGSIGVIDLETVTNVIDSWVPIPAPDPAPDPDLCMAKPNPGDCAPDLDHRETLICDAAKVLNIGAGVRIGNFATDIALQNFGNNTARLIVPTRGDPSIAWADYTAEGKLSCAAGSAGFALCDDAHRLATVQSDPDTPPIPDEPFGVFADPGPPGTGGEFAQGFAIVTHLTNGAVTLIDSPKNGNAQVADVAVNLFAPDPTTGEGSATGVAGRTPGEDGNIIYVGSRSEDRIQTFTVGRPNNNALPYLLPSTFFFLDAVGGSPGVGGSSDTRGMQFAPTGDRLFVVNRRPPSLQIFDTTLGPDGVPRNEATGASDICRQASTLTVFGKDDNERAYVTCFQDGEVYVVDPRGTSQVEDIITVGRGPYSVVATTYAARYPSTEPMCQATIDRSLLFVSNFLEDTIAVVDVTPSSPTRNRVVLRIGQPKVTP